MHWDYWFAALFLRVRHSLRRWVALHPIVGMLLICCVLGLVLGLISSHAHAIAEDGPTWPWPWPV